MLSIGGHKRVNSKFDAIFIQLPQYLEHSYMYNISPQYHHYTTEQHVHSDSLTTLTVDNTTHFWLHNNQLTALSKAQIPLGPVSP